MSAVSLCDPSSSGRWTGGEYWWAWRALSTPYSPAADQREREGKEIGGETKEIKKKKVTRGKVKDVERNKPDIPRPSLSELYPLS